MANADPYQISQAASDLLGVYSPYANQLYADQNLTTAQQNTGVQELFNASTVSAEDSAQAQADAITAQGDDAEAQQYLTAAGVADQNARLARASAQLQQYQTDRQLAQTLGTQQADIAAAGMAGGGSATYLARSSIQQGALNDQVIEQQGEITASGYTEQGDAARAEATAAETASQSATVLGAAASAASSSVTTNALNSVMALLSASGSGDNTNGGTNFDGVSAGEAAFDAAAIGWKQSDLWGGWTYQPNGGDGGYGIHISAQGRKAASDYISYLQRGGKPASGMGGLKVIQDAASSNVSQSGLG